MVPEKLRANVLKELHLTHMRIVKMKSVARSYFWWPGIDADIKNESKTCRECIQVRDNPPSTTLNPWAWPGKPRQHIHTDLIGPFHGKNFLLIIDAYIKWPEVFKLKNITSQTVIKFSRQVYARFGLPIQVVSDNSRQYTSEEFKTFLKHYGVKHTFSAVKHPSSNGAAEHFVKTIKKKMKALLRQGVLTQKAVNLILFDYCATKHSTTGESPARLMLGRELRTIFDTMRPITEQKVLIEQSNQA